MLSPPVERPNYTAEEEEEEEDDDDEFPTGVPPAVGRHHGSNSSSSSSNNNNIEVKMPAATLATPLPPRSLRRYAHLDGFFTGKEGRKEGKERFCSPPSLKHPKVTAGWLSRTAN